MKKLTVSILVLLLLLCGCNTVSENEGSAESSGIFEQESGSVSEGGSEAEFVDSDSSANESGVSDTEPNNEHSTVVPTNPMRTAVKYGDTVHLICYKAPISEKDNRESFDYSGSAVLKVDESDSRFIENSVGLSEESANELAKGLIGETRWADPVICSDESYEYHFYVNMVNFTVEPSFTIPKDWDYKFDSEIGSFKYIDEDYGCTEESADGDIFGYDDRLTETCSDWCGCMNFVCEVRASSTLENQGKTSYDAAHLAEYTRENIWAEGAEGYGIGESIEIRQLYRGTGNTELSFYSICIVNGNAKSERKWRENGRVKSLKLYYEGEYIGLITLEDTMEPQYIDISELQMKVGNGFEANFKFEIVEVYKGSKYEDTCLTGIQIDFNGIYAH